MFVSVKLCDLVGFPTIPGKNSKYAFWKILVFACANRLLSCANRLLSLLNEFFFRSDTGAIDCSPVQIDCTAYQKCDFWPWNRKQSIAVWLQSIAQSLKCEFLASDLVCNRLLVDANRLLTVCRNSENGFDRIFQTVSPF